MFDDIKGEVTIPIPLTQWAINFGRWATAQGRKYNYIRQYYTTYGKIDPNDANPRLMELPKYKGLCIVERKRRWDR